MCKSGPYQLFYYIPWPDSQGFVDLDPDQEHTSLAESAGVFADKEWVDDINMGIYDKEELHY
jgi:hypothetical protein